MELLNWAGSTLITCVVIYFLLPMVIACFRGLSSVAILFILLFTICVPLLVFLFAPFFAGSLLLWGLALLFLPLLASVVWTKPISSCKELPPKKISDDEFVKLLRKGELTAERESDKSIVVIGYSHTMARFYIEISGNTENKESKKEYFLNIAMLRKAIFETTGFQPDDFCRV